MNKPLLSGIASESTVGPVSQSLGEAPHLICFHLWFVDESLDILYRKADTSIRNLFKL
jgi:hypothetical protein